jgi:phosphatidylinositol phospholipase C, delta
MATNHPSGSPAPAHSSGVTQAKRTRPNNVLTNLVSLQPASGAVPPSAISISSLATTGSSLHESPLMTPEQTTSNSSMQPSPDGLRGREMDQLPPPPFQLPDPVISRKTSNNSLGVISGNAMGEVFGKDNKQSAGLMRRFSNRMLSSRRRQSSVTPNSRDTSVGPAILRRRSDSTNTVPTEHAPPALFSDSDGEELDDSSTTAYGREGSMTDLSGPSSMGSATHSLAAATAGPVIPLALLKGNWVTNVKKGGKERPLHLVLDSHAGKVVWDRKKKSPKCLYIDDIKDIYVGDDTKQYRLDCNVAAADADRFFSILYAVPDKSKDKVLHIIAGDAASFNHWTQTLDAISKHRQDLVTSLMAFNDKAIRAYWESEMAKQAAEKGQVESDGQVDVQAVERICRNLHIHVATQTIQANFQAAGSVHGMEHGSSGQDLQHDSSRLNFAQFQEFVRLMKRRVDVTAIYREIAFDLERGLTFADFTNFLCHVQGEDMSKDWYSVFSKFCRKYRPKEAAVKVENGTDAILRMSEAGLASFLTSPDNSPLWNEPDQYELDRPINEYFLSSSHNTYLLGRQVKGTSSTEAYVSALVRGCRCVEVDCWDGGDGQPLVKHGRTWTTSIAFREVINTINKWAFYASHFPLFISLEVHCNPTQQQIMVDIMKEVFGEKLVSERLPEATTRLPTPSELKDRILIKAKRSQNVEESLANGDSAGRKRRNSQPTPYLQPNMDVVGSHAASPACTAPGSPHANSAASLLSPRVTKTPTFPTVDTINEGEVHAAVSSSSSDCDEESGVNASKKPTRIIHALSSLAVYSMGLKFAGFDTPDAKTFNHIFSFKEGTFAKNSQPEEKKRQLFRHNMRYLMRVYPNQTRISSSNFDPLIYWKRGVQMVALNWQTFDLGMQLNRAMFAGGTDRSGYVLKATDLREFQLRTAPAPVAAGARHRTIVNFTIDVISAQQLMRPSNLPERRALDPYVEIEIFTPDDKRSKPLPSHNVPPIKPSPVKRRTEIVRDNGFNPVFDSTFTFHYHTKCPEMVFIRFSVKLADANGYNDRPPIAMYMAKLSSLKQGYRTIPLWDLSGDEYLFSTLFCRIKVEPSESVMMQFHGNGGDSSNKFKSLGGKVFNRSSSNPAQSPKSSLDSGLTAA